VTTYSHTTESLAAEFDVDRKTLRKKARALGIGIDFGGRAGFRYSEDDRRKLIDSLRPVPEVKKARKSRRRAA
jgi:hypothetical protein